MSNPVKGKGFYQLRDKRSAYPFTLQGCPTEHVKKLKLRKSGKMGKVPNDLTFSCGQDINIMSTKITRVEP